MTTQELPPPVKRIEIDGRDGLAIRQFIPEDSEPLFALIDSNREHLSQNHNGEPDDTADKYQTVEDVRESILRPKDPRKIRLGIWAGDTLVGSNNLTPLDDSNHAVESGSWVGRQFAGHHYAAQARELLIDLAFNRLGYQLIVSEIAVGNDASRKSIEKSGYEYKGIIQKPDKQGTPRDYWHYELTKEEFAGS